MPDTPKHTSITKRAIELQQQKEQLCASDMFSQRLSDIVDPIHLKIAASVCKQVSCPERNNK